MLDREGARHPGDVAIVELAVKRIGTSSVTFGYTIRRKRDGVTCFEADVITVLIDLDRQEPVPLDEELRKDLTEADPSRGAFLAEKLQTGLPAISLNAHTALITAVANDMDASLVFAQQVASYGIGEDVLIALSTSGNSRNVVDAAVTAKAMGMTVIGMTGEGGGRLKEFCDICIRVPATRTAEVQEYHLPVYHTICRVVEEAFFGEL
jgi:hypothetical protein